MTRRSEARESLLTFVVAGGWLCPAWNSREPSMISPAAFAVDYPRFEQ